MEDEDEMDLSVVEIAAKGAAKWLKKLPLGPAQEAEFAPHRRPWLHPTPRRQNGPHAAANGYSNLSTPGTSGWRLR